MDLNIDWAREVEESQAGKSKDKIKSEFSSSKKRAKPYGKNDTDNKASRPPRKPLELETDTAVLQRRQKQIDYGKNTVGYHNYMQQVPLDKRTKEHPKTPDKYIKYSRRSWDTLIKMWRIKLHEYDPNPKAEDSDFNEDEDNVE